MRSFSKECLVSKPNKKYYIIVRVYCSLPFKIRNLLIPIIKLKIINRLYQRI